MTQPKGRANDFIVGLTIIVTTIILIGAVLWVQQSDLGQKRRNVIARFRDVGNVRIGAQVVIRGVKAGRVERLELAPNGWVEARLALDPTAELPANPVVLLNESSLFGEWQATILGRDALPPRRGGGAPDRRGRSGGRATPWCDPARHRPAHGRRRANRR